MVLAAKRGDAKTARGGVESAKYFSSGTYSSAQLAADGHPYALRWQMQAALHASRPDVFSAPPPIPYGDLRIINAQSGEFRRDWVWRSPAISYASISEGSVVTALVKNTAPYAKYLEQGTWKMQARPINVLIGAWMTRHRGENIRTEMRNFNGTLS